MSGHADDGSDVGWMRGNHPHHNHNHHHPTHDTTGSESSSMNPSSLSSDSDLPIQPAATNAPLPASYQHRYELSHTEVTYPASPPEDLQHPKRLTYEEDLAALVDMISADGSVGSEVQVGVEGLPVRSVASSETGTGSPEARSPEMVPSVRQSVVHAPQLIGAGVMVGVGLSMASQPVEASHAARHRPPTAQRTVSPVPPMRVSPTPRRGEGGRGDGGSACDTPSSVGLSQISPINMSGLSGTSRNRTRSRTPSPLRGNFVRPASSGSYSTSYTTRAGVISARDAILNRNYEDLERNWRSPGRRSPRYIHSHPSTTPTCQAHSTAYTHRNDLRYGADHAPRTQAVSDSPNSGVARHSTHTLGHDRSSLASLQSFSGFPTRQRRMSPSPVPRVAPPSPAVPVQKKVSVKKRVPNKHQPDVRKDKTRKKTKPRPKAARTASPLPLPGDNLFRKYDTYTHEREGAERLSYYRSSTPLKETFGRTQTTQAVQQYATSSFRSHSRGGGVERSRSRSPFVDARRSVGASVHSTQAPPLVTSHRSASPKTSFISRVVRDTNSIMPGGAGGQGVQEGGGGGGGGGGAGGGGSNARRDPRGVTQKRLVHAVEGGRKEEVHELKLYLDGLSRKIEGVLQGTQSSRRKVREAYHDRACDFQVSAPPVKASQITEHLNNSPLPKPGRRGRRADKASDDTPTPKVTGKAWQALLSAKPL